MKELDHLAVELSGRNLIEASAGTGKTYAIAALYLRLVIEKGLTPGQILVVTYTEAATEELRGRIRTRLREALEVFSGAVTDDPILRGLAANRNGAGPGPLPARDRLNLALTTFDLAAIHTIHGFCLRALQDHAFESGSLYDTELVTDQTPLLREIVDDFWRTTFFTGEGHLLRHVLADGMSPDSCGAFLKEMLAGPELRIMPAYDGVAVEAVEAACRSAYEAVAAAWPADRAAVTALLSDDRNMSQAAGWYPPADLAAHCRGMDAFLSGGDPWEPCPAFERFTTTGVVAGTKQKRGTPPVHPFFELCEDLAAGVRERLLLLKWELITFARQRLPARKREANVRFFDDLLADLAAALKRENGPSLAASLRETYRAALIDEFQDTDPVQYGIFRRIYGEADLPLFLIGDPKQAIYSFRGADIFAYLEAAGDVEAGRRFTLTENWRSSPRLLAALNRLFAGGGRPFVYDEIAYHPVRAGNEKSGTAFLLPDGGESPLQVWLVPPGGGDGGLKVGDANTLIPAAVAAEISRLLRAGRYGTALVDGRPLLPQDVAVIVRNQWQAGYVQEALRAAGIPSVMRCDRSIFATGEAREICTLLAALADPGDETRVRTALITDLLGRNGDEIAALMDDEPAWDVCLQAFRDYHRCWLERGFMAMTRTLLSGEGVRGRLLRRPDGERRLTNLLHCFEVIHRAGHEGGLGIEGQVAWFSERVGRGESAEEYQIRLETDEMAVRIVTVHLSKGLEYPVVFCPFLWGGLKGEKGVVSFHDGYTLVKDFGSPGYDRHRALAGREALAESLRLLYVSLTRAKFRCYLVGGKFHDRNRRNRPETSPLAYLFHTSEATRGAADVVTLQEEEVKTLSAVRMAEQYEALAGGGGEIAVLPMPDPGEIIPLPPAGEGPAGLRCRRFPGGIEQNWRVASFTSFARHGGGEQELPDRDLSPAAVEPPLSLTPAEPQGMTIFTFPRGAKAGIFLHEIFEQLDFSAGIDAAAVAEGLRRHSFSPEWLHPVCSMVRNVLAAPLGTSRDPFTLSDLRPGSWITELEFFFPLRFVSVETLGGPLRRWRGSSPAVDLEALCRALSFRPVRGMVRGFMDLVFEQGGRYYLLDWKSNHLGSRAEEYGPATLAAAMASNLYPLQYLLYTVALNRYLSLRVAGFDYASHFGGVRYLFLRGIDPQRGEEFGIFRDLPPAGLMRELTELLVDAGG